MKIKANLVIKHGLYYIVLSYINENNKRKQKWIPTGITFKGNNKRLAQEKLEEIKLNYKAYIPIENDIQNNIKNKNYEAEKYFDEYLKEWLDSYKPKVEEDTYASYKIIINKICDYFCPKKIKLNELKPVDIQKFYDFLFAKGLTGNTILHYHANIRKALDTAYKLDIIPNNIADKIERPKKSQYIGSYYNINELKTLFEKSKGDPLELIILITSFYGLRRSEVMGLQWSSFDFNNDKITIKHTIIQTTVNDKRLLICKDKTKNQSSYRTLPLIPEIKKLLLEKKKEIEKNMKSFGLAYINKYKDYVFVNAIGDIIKPEYVTYHFPILLKNSNLRHIRFHDLRHSCASLLLAQGIPMKSIQEWLGHSTYSTTANLYTHLESDSKNMSANTLQNAFEM